jgi:hypothetical protein
MTEGVENPLALTPRVIGNVLALASNVSDKLVAGGRIVDAVQVALEHGWAG